MTLPPQAAPSETLRSLWNEAWRARLCAEAVLGEVPEGEKEAAAALWRGWRALGQLHDLERGRDPGEPWPAQLSRLPDLPAPLQGDADAWQTDLERLACGELPRRDLWRHARILGAALMRCRRRLQMDWGERFWPKLDLRLALQAAALLVITALALRLELGAWRPADWRALPYGEFLATSLHQGFGELRLDAATSGGPLRSGGVVFKQGLGVHAESAVRLAFKRQAARLSGLCGVDDACTAGGTVICRIQAGEKVLFESRKLACGMPPQPFSVPVQGLPAVMLVVSDAGDGNFEDHADWLELKLE